MAPPYDAMVIGGGFFGASIATYLAQKRRLQRVVVVEREDALLSRASYCNQARIHNGYHYPRSFTTAFRSRVNFPRFLAEYGDVVRRDFTKIYAVARKSSQVTAGQFRRFCGHIGAAIAPAPKSVRALFDLRVVEDVFQVEEVAFDALALRRHATADLARAGVEVRLGSTVERIERGGCGVVASLATRGGRTDEIEARSVFNCTYSGLNQFSGHLSPARLPLKHEIAEMALVEVPGELRGLGVTVMDGPFFSLMPFPPLGLHTLSHVRYTPHRTFRDEHGTDPYAALREYDRSSRFDRMIRDVARYLPIARGSRYRKSLFEVKTVLVKSETDDSRPILFERHEWPPRCYSILGGKIDNIYDVIDKLDAEDLV
jgi:glycine/D-amino acid oxidase-like deaminating enzyme